MQQKTLFLFIDEAGNFDFSPKGTRLFTLTCLAATDISPWVLSLHLLKHELIADGLGIERFHATEDYQWVRNRVFSILSQASHVQAHTVVIQKSSVPPLKQSPEHFYPAVFKQLIQRVFQSRTLGGIHTLVFIFDQIAYKRKRQAIRKGVKEAMHSFISPQMTYHILFHSSQSNPYLQAVDYFSWAIYVKWSRGEKRPYKVVQSVISTDIEIMLGL